MKKSHVIITALLLVIGVLCFVFFEVVDIKILKDATANMLLCNFISRFSLSILFIWLLFLFGGKQYLVFNKRFFLMAAWSLPCFMVAFVNFPFSAIITKEAVVNRLDLLGLYLLYVFSIALLEELVFRGVLVLLVSDYLRNNRHAPLLITIICSLVFSLFHITNLFVGADVGSTLLQCLYTFFIGAMLTATMLKTKNIWLCVIIHTIFNIGGLLIIHLGYGNAWDLVFWILTVISGVLCAGHIIFSLIKLDKEYASR